jgi:hypothetical protein
VVPQKWRGDDPMAMEKEVVGAIVAASASIVVAVFSAGFSLLTARRAAQVGIDLERFKKKLDEQAAERDARRDYEYDARKRLYSEVEPLLFQLYESLEEAHYRVRSLARTSRSGNLGEGAASWVDGPGYYLHSTMYKLILPVVHFRLMQRRVTFVDLNLDESIQLRYQLLKLYSRSFTDDFVLAAIAPQLRYAPNNEPSSTMRASEPAIYVRQALVLGDLENVADALLVQQPDKPARAMSFSDFDQLITTKLSSNESVKELRSLLTGFSPKARPVLARLLVAQACMAQLILSTFDQKTKTSQLEGRLSEIVSAIEKSNTLCWSAGKPCEDLHVAQQYWSERLKWVGPSTTWIERDRSA